MNMLELKRNPKRLVRSAATTALAATCLAGCVSNGTVPASWRAAQEAASSCEQIQGRFSNLGATPRNTRPVFLTGVLMFHGTDPSRISDVRVAIDASGVAKFMPESGPDGMQDAAPSSSKLALTCDRGVLSWSGSIRDLRDNNIGDPLVGPDRITFRVQRGADRALYVETHEVLGGLAYMFLPIGGSQTNRFRFPAVD
jgi:hypothetical protein